MQVEREKYKKRESKIIREDKKRQTGFRTEKETNFNAVLL
jgi:hypothetical protein